MKTKLCRIIKAVQQCTTIGHSPVLQHRIYIFIEIQEYRHTHPKEKPTERQIACHNTGICLLIEAINTYKIGLTILWSVFCH